jgi:hypothetical protein
VWQCGESKHLLLGQILWHERDTLNIRSLRLMPCVVRRMHGPVGSVAMQKARHHLSSDVLRTGKG